MGKANHTFIPVEQKLKELREGFEYYEYTFL